MTPASTRPSPARSCRRQFLRAAGVTLALPLLDCFRTARYAAARPRRRSAAWSASARRWACIRPISSRRRPARTTSSTPYLEVLKDFRSDFTVISGLCASRRRLEPRFHLQLSDRAPHPERGPAFATRSRWTSSRPSTSAGRRAFPACRCRPKGPACPGPAAARWCRRSSIRRACSPGCSSKAGPTKSRPRPGGCRTAGASSTRSATRPENAAGLGSAIAKSSTSTSPASASWSSAWHATRSGPRQPKPKVDGQAAAGQSQRGRPDRPDPAAVRPRSTWPCRPIRPG